MITCAAGELAKVSRHDLGPGIVQDEVQSVAVESKFRVTVVHGGRVQRFGIWAAGRDK